MEKEEKVEFALMDIKAVRVIAYFRSYEMANKRFEEILERHPWASDFLRIKAF